MNRTVQKLPPEQQNNAPKIITAIVTIITIVAFAWMFIKPFWFWTFSELTAATLVAFGCAGEWYFHHHPAGRKKAEKDRHHRIEALLIATVAIGVIMEMFITHERVGPAIDNLN